MSEGKNLIGVDIGTSSIKVCELKEGRKGQRTLVRFGYHPLPAQTIVDGHIITSGAVVEGQAAWTYPCVAVVEVPREQGDVPHYLPGQNKNMEELYRRWNISHEAFRGGAATMYPEWIKTHQTAERTR